ncbi:vWA domain-containing protein [Nitrosococcus wardiae]|nr:vWA domain-containing protein [Nitrosococcus wardiae]
MARLVNILVLVFTFLLGGSLPASAATEKRDIVLLLENSQSMQENDPEFLTQKLALNLINGLRGNTQIAIILFDGGTSVAMPLVPVSQETRDALAANLDKLSYSGRFRNSAAGMERALYELKIYGRPEAEKAIILLTNGPIETGDKKRDRDFSRWMQEYLAQEAAETGVKVFGIAFTEAADFHLIQILAHTTGGTYYRAPQAADLQAAFNRIRKAITPTSAAPAVPAIDIPGLAADSPSSQVESPVSESTENSAAPLSAENRLLSPPSKRLKRVPLHPCGILLGYSPM